MNLSPFAKDLDLHLPWHVGMKNLCLHQDKMVKYNLQIKQKINKSKKLRNKLLLKQKLKERKSQSNLNKFRRKLKTISLKKS